VTINSDGSVQILAEEAAPLEDFDLQVGRDCNMHALVKLARCHC